MSTGDVHLPAAFDRADIVSDEEIPMIDFGPFLDGDEASVTDALGAACRDIGFFYLTGHGVAPDLIAAAFRQIRWYFAQPFAWKCELEATTDSYRGFFPAREDTERNGIDGGSMEAFRLMLDLPLDDPDVLAGTPLYGPNRWPADAPVFRSVMEPYQREVVALATKLRQALALALGLDRNTFDQFFTKPLLNLQPAHYRGQPPDATVRELGVGEHRDTGGFTLLMQDGIPGLEVRDRSGRWIEAPIVPNAFVVNIGDSMMSWTNGEFVSTPHRVVNGSTEDRYICAMFMNPDFHCVVEPLAAFVSAERPAKFEPVHNGEYWWSIAKAVDNGNRS
jgi:isopenicillin N synthase-like dioxygenase